MPFGLPCCVMKLRCYVIDHLTHLSLLRRIHPGNRDVVFIWQKFSSPLTDQAALLYEHIENFTKDLEVRRDHGSRASPVNRAHMRGLQIKIETLMKYSKTQTHLSLFSLFLSLNSTFKGSLRRVGEKVLIIVARIVVCSVL